MMGTWNTHFTGAVMTEAVGNKNKQTITTIKLARVHSDIGLQDTYRLVNNPASITSLQVYCKPENKTLY